MTNDINQKLEELKDLICKQLGDNVTSVHITMTYQGVKFNFSQRGAKSLKKDAISMRNIQGEWIS